MGASFWVYKRGLVGKDPERREYTWLYNPFVEGEMETMKIESS